jgi:GT2 family glycosyltransferase
MQVLQSLPLRIGSLLNLVRKYGVVEGLRAAFWVIRTWLAKAWIRLQDQFGFYPYPGGYVKIKQELQSKSDIDKGDRESLPSIRVIILPDLSEDSSPERICKTIGSLDNPNGIAYCLDLFCNSESVQSYKEIIESNLFYEYAHREFIISTQAEFLDHLAKSFNDDPNQYVIFINPGDLLKKQFFIQIKSVLSENRDCDLIYFDEDIYVQGKEKDVAKPFFKPDWSPELFISVNYLQHAVIREILLWRLFQDRKQEEIKDMEDIFSLLILNVKNPIHIPSIIYNGISNQDPRSIEASRQRLGAVERHLGKLGLERPQAGLNPFGFVQVSWSFPEPFVSIIIPTRDNVSYLKPCVDSILSLTHYNDYELIIVDNHSQDPKTWDYYQSLNQKQSRLHLFKNDQEFNYSAYNNFGAAHAIGEVLLFLNDDIEIIEPNWLSQLAQWVCLPEIGIVGAKLLYPNRKIQHAGIVVGMEGHASHIFQGESENCQGLFGSVNWYRNWSAVTGACMMMRKPVFKEIGGFDVAYKLAFNDVEICLRVQKAGYRVLCSPNAVLIHHEGKTRGKHIPASDILIAYDYLHEQVIKGDPYYNPNLSYADHVPTLKRTWEEDRLIRLQKIVKYLT